jgi:hypothetical protein
MPHGESWRQHRKVLWRWLLVLAYAGGIFAVSAIPGNALPALKVSDKLVHAVEFGILAFLLCRALGAHMPARSRRLVMVASVLAAMTYGAVDEAHQLLVAQRMTEFGDFVADSLGATLAGWGWLKIGQHWPWLQ